MGSPNVGSRLGTRFGPYDLQTLIGVGGMGEVYRAFDTVRERMVAIKVLRTDLAADPSFRDRFRRESRIAARLQEPHVIPVHDFGEIDGVLYIDMRLVEGASVKDELRVNGTLPPPRTVSIIGQVADALDAAHANGLVHRDIKPENVLLTPDDFAYLVDFGIAYGGGEATVTKTGLVIGSCAYMATERLSGEAGGPASDVYSLTCLLYECLTGRAPFEAGDLRQVMSAHMFVPPPRPSLERRGISPAFDDVVAKGMAKNPADRYASAGELARAAAAAAQDRVPLPPPVIPTPLASPGTRQFPAMAARPTSTGYVPYPPVAVAVGADHAVALQQDAGGVVVRDDRHVRAGGGAGRRDRHDRRQWRLRAAESARCAATVDDNGHHHGTVRCRGDDDVHHDDAAGDHDVTVDQWGPHRGNVGHGRAGLRRSCRAMRRGEYARGGHPNGVVAGGGV
jgi:serine/threonine-protein kinase